MKAYRENKAGREDVTRKTQETYKGSRGYSLKSLLFATMAAVVFLLAVTVSPVQAILLDRIVAVIDKDIITWGELYKAMGFDLREQTKSMKPQERIEFLKKYEKAFLEKMIDIKLMLLYAEAQGIAAGQKEVDATIEDIRKKYNLTASQFEAALRQEGFTIEEYRKNLADQIVLSKVTSEKLASKVFVTEDEIKEYQANPEKGDAPVRSYRLSLLLLKKKDGNPESLMKKANEIYAQSTKGADFAELVAKYSEGPNTAGGGDIGAIAVSDMQSGLRDQIARLKEGEVSKPFLTDQGLNIIKVTGIKEEAASSSSSTESISKEEAKEKVLREKTRKAQQDWLKTLKQNRFIKIML